MNRLDKKMDQTLVLLNILVKAQQSDKSSYVRSSFRENNWSSRPIEEQEDRENHQANGHSETFEEKAVIEHSSKSKENLEKVVESMSHDS